MAKRFLGSVKANITILQLSLAIKGQSAMLHKRKIDGFSKTPLLFWIKPNNEVSSKTTDLKSD